MHELWARGLGTPLREVESGFRYTPTTTFETFPMPESSPEAAEVVAPALRHVGASAREARRDTPLPWARQPR